MPSAGRRLILAYPCSRLKRERSAAFFTALKRRRGTKMERCPRRSCA
ncbi:hypothetical protein PAMC26510_22310 [Caballeronia sordidicola]|uniref:Uncharacterized protein n=1 Tax=Caballeronia sordidicola TaxID=196367 RepID=A0A2C9XV20_CABSO|nr:hypothetical protein PAMC26510_22310 [Caballeronia sordidicola]